MIGVKRGGRVERVSRDKNGQIKRRREKRKEKGGIWARKKKERSNRP